VTNPLLSVRSSNSSSVICARSWRFRTTTVDQCADRLTGNDHGGTFVRPAHRREHGGGAFMASMLRWPTCSLSTGKPCRDLPMSQRISVHPR
jgi:hypothetical protein